MLTRLQTADAILAWLIAEDDGAKSKIKEVLADRDESLSEVRATLKGWYYPTTEFSKLTFHAEQLDTIGESSEEAASLLKDMLTTLIGFLR